MDYYLKTNCKLEYVAPKNGTDYKLDELQQMVGGYIQIISLTPTQIMVINEEGKLQGLKPNRLATETAHLVNAIADNDFIVGDCLVCESKRVK